MSESLHQFGQNEFEDRDAEGDERRHYSELPELIIMHFTYVFLFVEFLWW